MKRLIVAVLLMLTVTLGGCRAASEPISPEAAGITITLDVAPQPAVVGDATLVVSLRDNAGEPINDAVVRVRGDMNHAGMQPVLGESASGVTGDYMIPFEWTMGGDWFVIVTVILTDGRTVQTQFDYTVAGNMQGAGNGS